MIFSHQILHKHLRITACGMFSIDYSLVFNVSMKRNLCAIKNIKFDKCVLKKSTFSGNCFCDNVHCDLDSIRIGN